MNNNETIKKLQEMKLPVFVKHFREQLHSPELYSSMTFAERLALIVDAEFDARQNNKIKRLLKQSKIPDTSAYLGGIEYLPDRHLNREIFQLLLIDDFAMTVLSDQQADDFLSLIDGRQGVMATVFASQRDPSEWYDFFGEPFHADAVIDRILNHRYTIELKGRSLREKSSLNVKYQEVED